MRVCRAGMHAVNKIRGAARLRIADSDPTNVECVLSGSGGIGLDVVAQASPLAWVQYETVVAHAAQAFGPGTVHQSAYVPRELAGLGYNAAWIAAKGQLVATNGTQSIGGSYVTVTVTHAPPHGPSTLPIAEAVASATLATAPRGPRPGPPPS